jgi:hypothetical protein
MARPRALSESSIFSKGRDTVRYKSTLVRRKRLLIGPCPAYSGTGRIVRGSCGGVLPEQTATNRQQLGKQAGQLKKISVLTLSDI